MSWLLRLGVPQSRSSTQVCIYMARVICCRYLQTCCDFFTMLYRLTCYYITLTSTSYALAAGIVYVLSDMIQSRDLNPKQQMIQVACCIAIATKRHEPIILWLVLFAAVVHIMYSTILVDLRHAGDCRRCCNEAHGCTCGSSKDPLPPGTLQTLAILVEKHWVAYKVKRSTHQQE